MEGWLDLFVVQFHQLLLVRELPHGLNEVLTHYTVPPSSGLMADIPGRCMIQCSWQNCCLTKTFVTQVAGLCKLYSYKILQKLYHHSCLGCAVGHMIRQCCDCVVWEGSMDRGTNTPTATKPSWSAVNYDHSQDITCTVPISPCLVLQEFSEYLTKLAYISR